MKFMAKHVDSVRHITGLRTAHSIIKGEKRSIFHIK